MIFLGVSFAEMALKLEKVGPTVSSLNPSPSLPSFAIDDRKQLQCLNIALNNKTGPLFLEFNRCEDLFRGFSKYSKKLIA